MRYDTKSLEQMKLGREGSPITQEQGEAFAKKIGAARYVECSAKTPEGLDDVLRAAMIVALEDKKRRRLEKKNRKSRFRRFMSQSKSKVEMQDDKP